MTFQELKNKAYLLFPAVLLERIISHKNRKLIRSWVMVFLGIAFVFLILSSLPIDVFGVKDYVFNIRGAFFLIFSVWLIFYLLDLMYYSFYFKEDSPMDFEVAKIVLNTKEHDVTGSFLRSSLGIQAMLRLGIPPKDLHDFLKDREHFVTSVEYYVIDNDKDPYITVSEYARSIIHFDVEFSDFLKRNAVEAETYKGVINWVSRNQKKIRESEAWWTKERLQRNPSIGRGWAYGQIYNLERFGHPLYEEVIYQNIGEKHRLYEDDIRNIERVLLKSSGANIMLISNESAQAMSVVSSFGKQIEKGTVNHELEGRRIYVLDGTKIIDSMEDKINFEKQLNSVFSQAANAGNVVLVISDLPSFVSSASAIDVDVLDLLKNALQSERLHVIAVANSNGFHESIETHHDLMSHFEKIILPELDKNSAIEVVESEALIIEKREPVIFTFQSLNAAVESAERYFSDSSISEKSVDIIQEVVSLTVGDKRTLVTKSDIETIVEKRTGIPQGDLDEKEQNKLENLEKILHKRIVGQDMAIQALSTALRRSRAGLTDPKRPMGSFLFLGPTGVGKTETTKALADTFFNSEERIIRIDMSEYNTEEAIEKLIGSFETKQPGVLASKIREEQYGVLLLDEFEKASKKVHDLFLQILDEGYFTDGRGEKINARNLIIIATSNAGSDIIYGATMGGQDVTKTSDDIVNIIIERGIFKPELINRFDGTIVFHALTKENLKKVSKLMLDALNERLSGKGLKIKQTEELIDYLVEIGTDEKFGARAMKRAIQDQVEKIIAEGLISGKVKKGEEILLVVPKDTSGNLALG